MIKGAPYRLKLVANNSETGEPLPVELAADVDLVLYSSSGGKAVGKYGTGTGLTAVEKPSVGVFIVPVSSAETELLTVGGTAYLEGFILPCKKPVKIELGKVEAIKSNNG